MSDAQESASPLPSVVALPTAAAKIPPASSEALQGQMLDAQSLMFYAALMARIAGEGQERQADAATRL